MTTTCDSMRARGAYMEMVRVGVFRPSGVIAVNMPLWSLLVANGAWPTPWEVHLWGDQCV